MKDIFSKRQRFSLRKLTIGVYSVLLGTTIFATNAVAAEEVSATAAEATTAAISPATIAEATTETETTAAPAATEETTEKPEKPTETRVVNIPIKVEFEFTKKLEGRPLKDGEFSFVLKDKDGNVIETVTNDANGKIKFSALTFKRGEEGVYTYTVEEVKGT